MALAAKSFQAETSVEDNVSFRLLEQRVGHIESDVGEVKIDMRRLEAKIESTRDTASEVKDSVADLRVETKDGFADLRAEMTDGFATLRAEMTDGFAAANQKHTELAAAVTVLGARVDHLDQKTDALDGKVHVLDGKVDALDRKVDVLDRKVDVLDGKVDGLDKRVDALDKKIDDGLGAIHRKFDSFGEELMVRVNALFDRKFFRAISVFVGVIPPTVMLTSMAEKASLGTYPMLAIAVGIPVILITGTFLATRASR